VVGHCVRSHKRGGGFSAESPKLSHWGSVSGAPMKIVMGSMGGCGGEIHTR
jgi:hypothetical protein